MNSRVKADPVLSREPVMRLRHGTATILAGVLLLGAATLPQSDSASRGMSADELARKVVSNELKSQDEDHVHWMYRLEKRESDKKQVQEIVQTKYGSLSRLLSIDGRLLDTKQRLKETQRIQSLVNNPDEQRKLQREKNKKAEPGTRLFKILPDAFVFNYAGREGELTKLTFKPNPNFHPPSLEARVFHDMEGEMRIDTKQERMAGIAGELMQDVRFAGGLLGHLDKGGKFEVRQAEVATGLWEMIDMCVDMKGKALFFKTITVQENEHRSDFYRVPDDLTLAEAAAMLNKEVV
jgi:hypothetical protein